MSNCWIKQNNKFKALSSNKPKGLISSNRGVSGRISVVGDVRKEYRPFVSDASISLVGYTTRKVPINILQDTDATRVRNVEEFSGAWVEFGRGRICCYTGCQ